MGWRRFIVYAQESGLKVTEGEAQRLVSSFRSVYKEIEWSWRMFEDAVTRALRMQGRVEVLRHVVDATDPRAMSILLPSDRRIWYRNAALEIVKTPTGAQRKICYDERDVKGTKRIQTWGGKIVENVVQAGCRDLLCDAVRRCYEEDLCVLATVHDEIICLANTSEAEAAKSKLLAIMRTVPCWCGDLPMNAEGYVSDRYRK
jgi:DNA polymerase